MDNALNRGLRHSPLLDQTFKMNINLGLRLKTDPMWAIRPLLEVKYR
jgi:hypothetical protein